MDDQSQLGVLLLAGPDLQATGSPVSMGCFPHAGGERRHVGIVTFDSGIHFYSFNADRTGYQMLLVPDGDNPFPPAASSSLVVPLSEAMDAVSITLLSLVWERVTAHLIRLQ